MNSLKQDIENMKDKTQNFMKNIYHNKIFTNIVIILIAIIVFDAFKLHSKKVLRGAIYMFIILYIS
jgi:hypothetical protein